MIPIDRDPPPRHLLVFAVGLTILFAAVGALEWRAGSPRAATIVWCCGAVVAGVAFVSRRARRRLYLGWMLALFPVAWLVSYALLFAIYFLVATPTALLMRVLGRDPMQRRFDRDAATYWTPCDPPKDRSRHFRQF